MKVNFIINKNIFGFFYTNNLRFDYFYYSSNSSKLIILFSKSNSTKEKINKKIIFK
jgi:hypothetical protein